jgi:kynurenine/2-aminoadipate aminotransferase
MASHVSATKITDYSRFLSKRAKLRKPSPIRALQPLVGLPGMISLGSGMPNPSLFPISTMEIALTNGNKISISGKLLNTALQYSASPGIPELVEHFKRDTAESHGVSVSKDWGILISTGSQDAIVKMLDVVLDDGDTLLVENPTYPGTLAALKAMNIKLFGTDMDHEGMDVSKLRALLNGWETNEATKTEKKPKVIYVIPTGQNPSGATLSNARREELYHIAQEHDLLILEDDPYWHLQLKPYKGKSAVDTSASTTPSENVKSLFSMDTDGRVVRFDSLSKVVSSGLRIGYATGPSPLIYQLELVQQASSLHTSGIAQAIVLQLLESLGPDGWKQHVSTVQDFYSQRRDVFIQACEAHLAGLAEWHAPKAGMFVWLKLIGIDDSSILVKTKCAEAKVLAIPGEACTVDGKPSPFIRCAFSTATDADIHEALRRLSELLKQERGL